MMRASALGWLVSMLSGVGGTLPPRLSPSGNGKGVRFLAAAGKFSSYRGTEELLEFWPGRLRYVAQVPAYGRAITVESGSRPHAILVRSSIFVNDSVARDTTAGLPPFIRKRAACLNDLSQTHVQRFHCIDRIDDLANLCRKSIERDNPLPVAAPDLADCRMCRIPFRSKLVQPSIHAMKMSRTPRFWMSVSTCSQNFAPSLAEVHKPRTSLYPSRWMPMATYTARFCTWPLSRIRTCSASR